jgi:molybdopterin-biosynthesis enzyme MoeA-like protein
MIKKTNVNAAILIIGNEILSGRTQDTNTSTIALWLNSIGVKVQEVRVIPDIEDTIIETVKKLRKSNNYVFTTGGIGPLMAILPLNQFLKHLVLIMKFIRKHLKF